MRTMEFTRCFGCMEPVKTYPCPICGFDPRKAPPENALRPGTILKGRYIAGSLRAHGTVYFIYTGWDLLKERKVAVKEYFPEPHALRQGRLQCRISHTGDTLREKQLFLQEPEKLSRLGQIPQVPACTDAFDENGTSYLVTEYPRGQTLAGRLAQTAPLSWKEVKNRLFPVIQAMEKVHAAGIAHLGLCPESLLMKPDGSVGIQDFTFSSDLKENTGITPPPGPYAPPELYIPGGKPGTWSDVYSLAAVMYLALTGKAPVLSLDRLEQDGIDWALLGRGGVPRHVPAALQKAMILKESARTQTMTAFLKDLQSGSGLPRAGRTR